MGALNTGKKARKVFLSSTYEDLKTYRQRAIEVLKLLGLEVVYMETFSAQPQPSLETSLKVLADCELFVGIYAHKYGIIPPAQEHSIIELEYNEARNPENPEEQKKCFFFLVDKDIKWPEHHYETDPKKKAKLKAFKERIQTELTVMWFTTTEDLGMKIAGSVGRHLGKSDAETTQLVQTWLTDHRFKDALLKFCRQDLQAKIANDKITSYYDQGFDDKLFVDRKTTPQLFREFLNQPAESSRRIFVIGGDAGTGKSWEMGHLLTTALLEEELFTFYVSGWLNLHDDLETTVIALDVPVPQQPSITAWKASLRVNALEVAEGHLTERNYIKENTAQQTIIFLDGLDEAKDDKILQANLQLIRKLIQNKVWIVLSVRTISWEMQVSQVRWLNAAVWKPAEQDELDATRAQPRFSIIMELFTPKELKAARKQYELPKIDTWPPKLVSLATRPFWLRIIWDYYNDWKHLPSPRSMQLIKQYFQRMNLFEPTISLSREKPTKIFLTLQKFTQGWFEEVRSPYYFQLSYDRAEQIAEKTQSNFKEFASWGFLEEKGLGNQVVILEENVALYLFLYPFFDKLNESFLTLQNKLKGFPEEHCLTLLSILGQYDPNYRPQLQILLQQDRYSESSIEKLGRDWSEADISQKRPASWTRAGQKLNVEDALLLQGIPESMIRAIETDETHYITGLDIISSKERLSLFFDQVRRLRKLSTLRLRRLKTLPETLGILRNLKELSLDGNQLTSLPETLGNLRNLVRLSLYLNKLSSFPASMGQLKNLQTLDLDGNQLDSLPETFGNLRNLQTLRLNSNRLSSLPESFFQLTNLQSLNLGRNQFTSLPASIEDLKNLQILILESNLLSSVPASIGGLKSLRNLTLHSNQLSSLPETIGNLKNLQILILWGNQLSSLPASMTRLINLKNLFVDSSLKTDPIVQILHQQGVDVIFR